MADMETWDRLWEICYRGDPDDVAYVYRVDADGAVVKPYFLKCTPTNDLPEMLRDDYGGGAFRILVRRCKKMILSGTFDIEPLPPPREPRRQPRYSL